MPIHVKVGGAWKEVSKVHLKVGGAWKEVDEAHIRTGAAWKSSHVAEVVTLSGHTISAFAFGSNATAGLRVNTDGTIDQNLNGSFSQIDSATDWIIPNSAASSDYEVRLTVTSGDGPTSGPATGTWYAMSVDRSWYFTDNTPTLGGKTGTWLLEIRKNGGSVIDSASYFMDADREDF